MTTLLISEFKTHCLAILDRVASNGEEVLVCRRGKPLARVVPVSPKPSGKRQLGTMAGEAIAHGDIVHFDSTDLWESAS